MQGKKTITPLRMARISRGWTLRETAEKIGVTVATLQKWETEKAAPDIISAFKVAAIYDADINEIFDYFRN